VGFKGVSQQLSPSGMLKYQLPVVGFKDLHAEPVRDRHSWYQLPVVGFV